MDLNWAFSITDAIVDGIMIGMILQFFSLRQSKKDQRKIEEQQKKAEEQEKEDSEMLDKKLDKLYDRLIQFERKHDKDVE